MLCKLKKIVQEYDSRAKCEEWDTAGTLNNTKGPYRFGVYRPTRKPWDRNRVKSQELIGGEMHSHCLCIKRNGLQDECRRRQCRGSPQCRLQPFPSCPPFTMVPAPIPVEDPFK
ncbi:hypothetical protein AAG570_001027 [Ranatra chinensis]|uniref:Uncharacterized protein n=1 Tax=Ranatra chinensis TaxID=642074 RepID=A0ABD0YAP6_9HEMI